MLVKSRSTDDNTNYLRNMYTIWQRINISSFAEFYRAYKQKRCPNLGTAENCVFVNLLWPWCHSCNIFDIDEFARVRKVINEMNRNGTCTLFYIPNPESDEIAVHIQKNFILVEQIPYIDQYLQSVFREFFATARELEVEIEKCRLQERQS